MHRNMIAELGQNVTTFTVSEDGTSFSKLVDGCHVRMYAPEAPLTTDVIDELSGKCSRSFRFTSCDF